MDGTAGRACTRRRLRILKLLDSNTSSHRIFRRYPHKPCTARTYDEGANPAIRVSAGKIKVGGAEGWQATTAVKKNKYKNWAGSSLVFQAKLKHGSLYCLTCNSSLSLRLPAAVWRPRVSAMILSLSAATSTASRPSSRRSTARVRKTTAAAAAAAAVSCPSPRFGANAALSPDEGMQFVPGAHQIVQVVGGSNGGECYGTRVKAYGR